MERNTSLAVKKEIQPANTGHRYVSVYTFIQSAKPVYHMSKLQEAGFKTKMLSKGMEYAKDLSVYVPYLKEYLGLK